MSDEENKVQVLTTHELIQQQHNINRRDYFGEPQQRHIPMQQGNLDPIQAMQIMLQAIMDKLSGLDSYMRQNDGRYANGQKTYDGIKERKKDAEQKAAVIAAYLGSGYTATEEQIKAAQEREQRRIDINLASVADLNKIAKDIIDGNSKSEGHQPDAGNHHQKDIRPGEGSIL